jgi:hypothetical protein
MLSVAMLSVFTLNVVAPVAVALHLKRSWVRSPVREIAATGLAGSGNPSYALFQMFIKLEILQGPVL